jgi:uncharacterized protein YgbK (DUF1537 family)
MSTRAKLQLAFYGDDFTGSTDALDALSRTGLRTRLFVDPPTPALLAALPPLDAIGVAGATRSLAPDEMERVLAPAFGALRELGPRHVFYKVCSTFDSSPKIGSIGRAIEVGFRVFGGPFVPVLVAAPALGRYCVFGNLFARYGAGSNGPVYRLDRHPAISVHPVTPMTEANLRTHLGEQTDLAMGLVDLPDVEQGPDVVVRTVRSQCKHGADLVFFDALTEAHLKTIGSALEGFVAPGQPFFSVGSSGLGTALVAGLPVEPRKPAVPFATPRADVPVLVVSGSCSPVTAGQIAWAEKNGFATLALSDTSVAQAAAELAAGRHVLIYSSRGAPGGAPIAASNLGARLGHLARELAARHRVRLVVAGGDTSSYAARALGIASLEMIAPLAPGAPLCRAHAPGSPVDGMEVNFKGGQVGAVDYFGAVTRGKL